MCVYAGACARPLLDENLRKATGPLSSHSSQEERWKGLEKGEREKEREKGSQQLKYQS